MTALDWKKSNDFLEAEDIDHLVSELSKGNLLVLQGLKFGDERIRLASKRDLTDTIRPLTGEELLAGIQSDHAQERENLHRKNIEALADKAEAASRSKNNDPLITKAIGNKVRKEL